MLPVEKQADEERKQLVPTPKVKPEFLDPVTCRTNPSPGMHLKNKAVKGN